MKMSKENLRQTLWEKAAKEQSDYIEHLKTLPPEQIIDRAYEKVIRNFMKYAGVKAFLGGIRPCVVGLILATAITMFMSTAIGFSGIGDTLTTDFNGIIILVILILINIVAKLALKKKPTPILMILISAGLGMLMYSL